MTRRKLWRAAVLPAILPTLALMASLCAAESAAPSPTPAQIATWIRALDDESYAAREQAVEQLIAAGRAAVGPVAKAMLSDSPEAAWRANDVLEQIGITGDEQTLELVSQALEEVSRSGKGSLVKSKSEVQRRWKTLRHDRAVAQIVRLGGKVHGGGGIEEGGVVFMGGGMAFGGFGGMMPAVDLGIVVEEEAFEIEAKLLPAKLEVPVREIEGKPVEVEAVPVEEAKPPAEPAVERGLEFDLKKLPELKIPDAPPKVESPLPEATPATDLLEVPDLAPAKEKEGVFAKMIRALRESVPLGLGEERPAEFDRIELDGIRMIEEVEAIEFLPEGADLAEAAVAFDMVDFEMGEGQGVYRIEIGKDWKGGVEGFALFKDVMQLARVELHDVEVQGEHVEQLEKIAQLQQLHLQRCRFDRAAIEKLKKSRPELSVLTFGEAVMGISGDEQGDGFRVSFVAPNSGAQAAGIQIDDVITRLDGEELRTFERLTHLIAAHRVGDKLPVELVREGKPRKIEVTLQVRPIAE